MRLFRQIELLNCLFTVVDEDVLSFVDRLHHLLLGSVRHSQLLTCVFAQSVEYALGGFSLRLDLREENSWIVLLLKNQGNLLSEILGLRWFERAGLRELLPIMQMHLHTGQLLLLKITAHLQ